MYNKDKQYWLALSEDSANLEKELSKLADDLATLEKEKWKAEESKYVTIEGECQRVVSLENLKKEIVETVGLSYEPEGKTKDERSADLVRYVRAEYGEYDDYENRIQGSEQTLRKVKSEIVSKERQFAAVQKRLWSVQTKIDGLNQLFGYYTVQEETKNIVSKFSVIEHRIIEMIIKGLDDIVETNSGAIDAQKAALNEMLSVI